MRNTIRNLGSSVQKNNLPSLCVMNKQSQDTGYSIKNMWSNLITKMKQRTTKFYETNAYPSCMTIKNCKKE